VLLDPQDVRYATAFNPLSCGLADPGETASMVLEAFLKAWGADSFDQTPRLEGVLRGMFRLLIEGGLTLLEGYDLLNVDNSALRKILVERVGDRFIRQDWLEFEKLSKTEKLTVVESSRNRLRRLLQAAPLQWMFGQTEDTLNLKSVMDDGQFLLANLGDISCETQRLLGALLVNGIFHAGKSRNSRRRRDWYLIVDEFGEFATRDFANSLDQLRKFGVHLILAHQRLHQLEREDRDVLSAVMTNAKIKVVFGGLSRPDAETMAKELYTGDVHGNRVKHVTMQTKFRPIDDEFMTETESWSEGETDSDSSGRSEGRTTNESEVNDSSSTLTSSEGRSRGSTSSRSHSRSYVPRTTHEEFEEESGRQFYSLDEEWEKRIGLVHGLPKRHALIKVYNRPVIHIVTPEVEAERRDERLERFQNKVMTQCPYVKPVEVVVEEIEERRRVLALLSGKTEADRSKDVKSFRE
jgi:hypothetical protein